MFLARMRLPLSPVPPAPDPPAPAAWVAWSRPSAAARRVWRPVAEGPTEAECFRRMLGVIRQQGPGARDWVCLPRGEKP